MELNSLKEELINNKKYLIIYLILVIALTFLMFSPKNYQYWGFEAVSIPIITIIGLVLILFSFKKNLEMEKVALVLIIVFGLIMVFLAPPMAHPDEMNHFTRAELLSEGILFPEKTDMGVRVNDDYYFSLNEAQKGLTVFDNPHDFDPITEHKGYTQTNDSPFYSYIPSAIGILLAKCLHLTSVFALFFARLLNLILYAGVAYWAIKKAPAYKIGLTLIATMPIAIAQVSSTSYDAFIITFTLIILAYFIKMYKEKAENKDLAIFFISILLISLIKPPYIMLSFLIFTIPKDNFVENRNYSFIAIILLFAATVLSFSSFLTPTASTISASANNISSSAQLTYIINNPTAILDIIKNSITLIPDTFVLNSSFFHYADFKGLKALKLAYLIFFILFAVLYQQDINFSKRNRLILSSIFLIIYFGIFAVLYLIWTPVGSNTILGVQSRYFVPIIALLPFIINYDEKSFEEYNYLMMLIITFLVGLVLLTITHYY